MRFKWDEEAVKYLKDNYGHKSSKEIGVHFGVSPQAVRDKARKIGLKAKVIRGEYWSTEDDKLLRKHFKFAPKDLLMEMFPHRSWAAISQRGWKTLNIYRETQDRISINYNFFDKWTEQSSYIMGFIVADGYLYLDYGPKNSTSLQIDIASQDRDILEKITNVMEYKGTIKNNRSSSRIFIANRKIIMDLINKGVSPTDKTNTASWPFNIPEEYVRHFIRGYFDGDGSICESQGMRINFIGTESIMQGIKSHVPVGNSNKIRLAKKGNLTQMRLNFGGKTAYRILNWMYQDATIYLDRKYNRYIELCEKFPYSRIKTP